MGNLFKVGALLALLLMSFVLTASAHAGDGVPAFKVVSPNGETSILIGSLHIPHQDLRQPAARVLDGAKHFVVEHSTEDEIVDLQRAPEVLDNLKLGKTIRAGWAQFLSRDQVERLHQNAICAVGKAIPADSFEEFLKLKSPKMVLDLAYMPCSPPGLLARDTLLGNAAQARAVPRVTLETQESMQSRRRAISDRAYASALRLAVNTDIKELISNLVDALNGGDFQAVAKMVEASYPEPSDAALFHKVMVHERNDAWMPALRVNLDAGHAVIVVGAAHLPGEDGLIALLSKSGYVVQPISLPTD